MTKYFSLLTDEQKDLIKEIILDGKVEECLSYEYYEEFLKEKLPHPSDDLIKKKIEHVMKLDQNTISYVRENNTIPKGKDVTPFIFLSVYIQIRIKKLGTIVPLEDKLTMIKKLLRVQEIIHKLGQDHTSGLVGHELKQMALKVKNSSKKHSLNIFTLKKINYCTVPN